MPYSPIGPQPLGFAPLQPFGVNPWQAYVQPGDGHWSTPGMHRVAAISATLGRVEPSATHSAVPQPIGGLYSLGGSVESHLIPLPSLHGVEGSSFPGLVPSDDAVNSDSVIDIKPGDSGVVIGYQVDESTRTWSAEWFVACSHIYPGFTSKVSSLTHFLLEPGCEDYVFFDQAVADFKQRLDSILTDSLETPDWILPWMSLMPLHLLQSLLGFSAWLVPFLIILSHSLVLPFGLINCDARLRLFLPLCLWLPRCQHLNWFVTFLATVQPLDFRCLLHQITSLWILPAGKLISLSDFQTGLGAAAHATFDTEQLISHLQVALVDTLSSLPEAERDVIPVNEMCELLLWIHGILDKAVAKWVGISACILAHLFNSVSRQCREVWASQFPFLHSLKEVLPPSKACLYGHINWSLAQAHSASLPQSFPPKRVGKARPQTGFQFTVHKRPMSGSVPGTSGASLPKQPYLESGNEACLHGKKSAGSTVSTNSTESRRKGGHGGQHSWCATALHLFILLIIYVCNISGWFAFQIFWSMEKHYIQ